MGVHAMAAVDPAAEIHPEAIIGPFCCIGPHVKIGARTELRSNVDVIGNTTIGCENVIHPFAAIGTEPQDLTYQGEETKVEIGDRNVIRECVTIHRATAKDDWFTRIGDGNLLMACSHVAHDCIIDNNAVLANSVLLGGHVRVEDDAIINGNSAVNPFATIGRMSYVGGLTRIVQDVPPFMIVEGNPSKPRGVNIVGLKRHELSDEKIAALKKAFWALYRSGRHREDVLRELEGRGIAPEVSYLVEFLRTSEQGRYGRARESMRKTKAKKNRSS